MKIDETDLTQDNVRKTSIAFEEEYGATAFVKACLSTLNLILVAKGVCTREDLNKNLLMGLRNYSEIESLRNAPGWEPL